MHQANRNISNVKCESGQAGKPAAKPVLDEDHLSHYTLGDEALAIEILQLFVAQVDVYLDGLEGAKDGIEWQEIAHGLKGSARAIGAWALADLAETAEHAILSDVGVTQREYLPRLSDQVLETKEQISEILLKSKVA